MALNKLNYVRRDGLAYTRNPGDDIMFINPDPDPVAPSVSGCCTSFL